MKPMKTRDQVKQIYTDPTEQRPPSLAQIARKVKRSKQTVREHLIALGKEGDIEYPQSDPD